MAQEVKVLCDECGKDISKQSGKTRNRLILYSEKVPSDINMMYLIYYIEEFLYNPHYFCDINCLNAWTKRKILILSSNKEL